jgi:hypothetical protein
MLSGSSTARHDVCGGPSWHCSRSTRLRSKDRRFSIATAKASNVTRSYGTYAQHKSAVGEMEKVAERIRWFLFSGVTVFQLLSSNCSVSKKIFDFHI